ncbi:MAG: hypothetical protein LAT67_07910 [Balneolales bacterium]|nr:hypothetical protein [Balneolales bacterium]
MSISKAQNLHSLIYRILSSLALSALLFTALIPRLYAQDLAFKASAGTQGFGIEVLYAAHHDLNLRLGVNALAWNLNLDERSTDEFDLNGRMVLQSMTLLADWHPFSNFHELRFTSGVVLNMNEFKGVMIPTRTFTVGGDVYTPEDLGNVDVNFDFPLLAPYFAVGFGHAFTGGQTGIQLDLGLFYQQSPRVTFLAEGLLAPTVSQAEVMENNIRWAKWYPVATLSFYYRL